MSFRPALVVAMCAALGADVPAQETRPRVEQDFASTFAWLDARGMPAVAVADYGFLVVGDEKPRAGVDGAAVRRGFVTRRGAGTLTIWCLDTLSCVVPQGEAPAGTLDRHFVAVDLRTDTRLLARALRDPYAPDKLGSDRCALSLRGQAIVLARQCARIGCDREARLLLAAAGVPTHAAAGSAAAAPTGVVVAEFSRSAYRQFLCGLADPTLDWEGVHTRCRWWSETVRPERRADGAAAMERLVATMAADPGPRAHAATDTRSLDDEIDELIFRLRDVAVLPIDWKASLLVPESWRRRHSAPRDLSAPHERLAALGFAAVPKLIAALGDARPARSWAESEGFDFGPYAIRVSDWARTLLEYAACRELPVSGDGEFIWGVTPPPTLAGVQAPFLAWWESVRGGTASDAWAAALEETGDAWRAGRRLAEVDPERALDVIERMLAAQPDSRARGALIRLAGSIPGARAAAILDASLHNGTTLDERREAAAALHRRGTPGAVAAMIDEWERTRAAPVPVASGLARAVEAVRGDEDFVIDGGAVERLVEFLLASQEVAAVEAIARGLEARPRGVRDAVVRATQWVATTAPSVAVAAGPLRGPATAIRLVVERAFEERLDDRTRMRRCSDGDLHEPRRCDRAARALCQRWPLVFPFVETAPERIRDRDIARMKNVLRADRGQEPLPLSGNPVVPRVDSAVATGAIDAVLSADAGAPREAAVAALTSLGIGALAAVRARIATLPPAEEPADTLDAVANVLRNEVIAVLVDERVVAANDAGRALAALKGTTLDSKRLLHVWDGLPAAVHADVAGFTLTADRAGDDSGVIVRLEVAVPDGPGDGAPAVACALASPDFSESTAWMSDASGGLGRLGGWTVEQLGNPHAATIEIRIEWRRR